MDVVCDDEVNSILMTYVSQMTQNLSIGNFVGMEILTFYIVYSFFFTFAEASTLFFNIIAK